MHDYDYYPEGLFTISPKVLVCEARLKMEGQAGELQTS